MKNRLSHKFTIISTERPSPSILLLTAQGPPVDRLPDFLPGQYATLSFARGRRRTPVRCFSIASSLYDYPNMRFAIRLNGKFTKGLSRAAQPDETIYIDGPFGEFVFNETRDTAAVFLAGGIGIAPFMGMLRYISQRQLTTPVILFYACHSANDVIFLQELVKISQLSPSIKVLFVISEGPLDRLAGQLAVSGSLTPELIKNVINDQFGMYSFFICGPPSFLQSFERTLPTLGARPDYIFTEEFGQTNMRRSLLVWPNLTYSFSVLGLVVFTAGAVAADTFLPKATNAKQDTTKTLADAKQNGTVSRPKTPPDLTLNASAISVKNGDEVTLSWQSSDGATCLAYDGWIDSQPNTGTAKFTPIVTTTYTLACTNSKGTTEKSVTVEVVAIDAASSAPTPTTTSTSTSTTTPTSTPKPTPTRPPAPTPVGAAAAVSLTASPTTITQGGSVTLAWSSSNASSCTANWGAVGTSGSSVIKPSSSATYTISCKNSAGATGNTASVSVTVNPVPSPTVAFSANPTTINAGSSAYLTWSSTNATSCSTNWGASSTSGNNVAVSPTSTTTYTLTCRNSVGTTASKSITITVSPVATGS